MDGSEIFAFTLEVVPKIIDKVLERENKSLKDIDLFVFHQANKYILEQLRNKIKISEDKFYVSMEHCGNTVSSTIPITLKNARDEGLLKLGQQILLVGFGVGYSWGASIIKFL